jgi:hypothetical protein
VVGYVRARSYVCCGEDGDQIDACVNGCVCARESGMSCEASLSHRSIMSTHTRTPTLTSPPPRLSHLHARAHPQGHALILTLVQSPHVTSRTSSQLPTQSQSQSRTLHLTSHHISLTSPPRYLCGIFRQFNQALFPATFNSPRLHKWCVRMPQYLALARIRRVSLQDLLRCQLWRSLCANSVSLDHAPHCNDPRETLGSWIAHTVHSPLLFSRLARRSVAFGQPPVTLTPQHVIRVGLQNQLEYLYEDSDKKQRSMTSRLIYGAGVGWFMGTLSPHFSPLSSRSSALMCVGACFIRPWLEQKRDPCSTLDGVLEDSRVAVRVVVLVANAGAFYRCRSGKWARAGRRWACCYEGRAGIDEDQIEHNLKRSDQARHCILKHVGDVG